mmetsp:Transcript_11216/g.45209  ORF Transcript_11216/g.45209 Transcript_11216/m.45209 type:complete len:493 (-) Transcript_11216:1998-3476(-)
MNDPHHLLHGGVPGFLGDSRSSLLLVSAVSAVSVSLPTLDTSLLDTPPRALSLGVRNRRRPGLPQQLGQRLRGDDQRVASIERVAPRPRRRRRLARVRAADGPDERVELADVALELQRARRRVMKPGYVRHHGFVERRGAILGEGSNVGVERPFGVGRFLDGRFDGFVLRREALRGDVVRLADERERGGASGRWLLPRELRPRLHLLLVWFKIRASLQTRERLLDDKHERLEPLARCGDDGVGHVADALGVATVDGDAARLRGAPRDPQRARQILDDGIRRNRINQRRCHVGLDIRRRVPRSRLDRVAYPRVRVPRAFNRVERVPRGPQHRADARLGHVPRIRSPVEPTAPPLALVHGGVESQPAQTLRLADERLGERELLVDGLAQRGGGRDGARDPREGVFFLRVRDPVRVPVVKIVILVVDDVVGGSANGLNDRAERIDGGVTRRRGEYRRAPLARLPVPADEPVEPGYTGFIRSGIRNRASGGSRQTH